MLTPLRVPLLLLLFATASLPAQRAVSLLALLSVEDEAEAATPQKLREEHEERIAMAREALQALEDARLPYADDARQLVAAAESSGPFAGTARLAAGLHYRVVHDLRLPLSPRRVPDLRRGERLYAQACAACHGPSGVPPAANPLQLSTAPPVLGDRAATRALSPLRIFDAMTAGIPHTAMPSFGEALSEEERWELAFFLRAVAHPAPTKPAAPPLPLRLTLRDAATQSDEQLQAQLEAAGLRPEAIDEAIAAVRWRPPGSLSRRRPALVVPGWLIAARLVTDEVAGDGALKARVVLLEAPGNDRNRVLSLAKLLARQMFLRAERPPPELDLRIYATVQDLREDHAIAACSLSSWAYYRCGVAPADPSAAANMP